jgi:two-component system sensor histidine kinase PilS (NtrC family)
MGSIQVLKEERNLTGSNLNLMQIILRESERLNRLVTDFLLFAQPPRTNMEMVILNQLIDETLQMLTNSPQFNNHINIVKHFPHDVQILGDAHQLTQVFWNLFLNAVQEMENGGKLTVKLDRTTGQDHPPLPSAESCVKVSVSDTGRGIRAEDKAKIFEPFFSTKDTGTGLGLAIVHRIVETHRGQIRVDSQIGKGATFTLYFPEIARM